MMLLIQFIAVPLLAFGLVWLFEFGPMSEQARRDRAQRRREAKTYRGPERRRYRAKPDLRYGSSSVNHKAEQGNS